MPADYRIGRLGREYIITFYDAAGKRHRHRLGTTDPREAAFAAPAVYAELTRPKGTVVKDLWAAYCGDMAGRAVIVTMGHTWKAMRDRFGPMQAETITIADCRAHTAGRRAAGIKDGTIHTELGHLRMVLKWAEKHRLITRAPHIERPGKPPPVDRHLTRDQVRTLADACTMPHLRLFVMLAYGTAGRAGAILDLTWDRIDFERGMIDLENPDIALPHKGRAIVPMTRTLKVALLEAKAGALSPYVIEWGGEQVESVKKGLATAGNRAGLGHVSPHMLRHSSAVQMAESGEPMEEIASFLGHRDTSVTRRIYARFSPHHLRRAAEALELDDLVLARRDQRPLRK
jgi:integrase